MKKHAGRKVYQGSRWCLLPEDPTKNTYTIHASRYDQNGCIDLLTNVLTPGPLGWGPDCSAEAAQNTALTLLLATVGKKRAKRHVEAFAREVVPNMHRSPDCFSNPPLNLESAYIDWWLRAGEVRRWVKVREAIALWKQYGGIRFDRNGQPPSQ